MSAWSSALKKQVVDTTLSAITARMKGGFAHPHFLVKDLDWERLVGIDFETYYDQDYTLKKLSTSEYVRDPRFKAQMLYLKIGDKPVQILGPKQIGPALKKINWKTHALLAHHTQFDGLILSHHYGVVPSYYCCSMSMARGLHSNEIGAGLEEVSLLYGGQGKVKDVLETTAGVRDWSPELFAAVTPYCHQDGDEMLRVFKEMWASMPAEEMDLIDVIVRMFCDPVLRVNLPRVKKELEREIKERDDQLSTIINPADYADQKLLKGKEKLLPQLERDLLTARRVIGSNERFADLLRAEGVEPPEKISPAWIKKPAHERKDEDKFTYAFANDDEGFINLAADHEKLSQALDLNNVNDLAKLVAKQTRLQALIDTRLVVKSTTNITRAERLLTAGANGMACRRTTPTRGPTPTVSAAATNGTCRTSLVVASSASRSKPHRVTSW
jgi:DNA polymerase